MTIYSAYLSESPFSYIVLGSEYMVLENNINAQISNNVVITHLGEEWITKRLADENEFDDLWMGWGLKDSITTGPTILNLSEDGLITREAGSFIDDGFIVGQQVILSGWLTETNNTTKVIKTVTDETIELTTDYGLYDELGSGNEVLTVNISKYDTQLFNEVDTRNKCHIEVADFEGDAAIYRASCTLVVPNNVEREIKEVGVFDALEGGNLIAHAVFDPYSLNPSDEVMFTLGLNPE